MSKERIGVVLYEGPSLIDGAPIVVIATGLSKDSDNAKTGAMIQTWIMRSDLPPGPASKGGQDASICGDCPLRPSEGGSCYVLIGFAPRNVWATWKRGRYGDPLTPAEIREVIGPVTTHTGYTRQWGTTEGQTLRHLLMASVFSPEEAKEARALGFRTFRTAPGGEGPAHGVGEVTCPASKEGGHRATCEDCGLCTGQTTHTEAEGRAVRLGSYGDPAAAPAEVWEAYTGQTEAFRSPPASVTLRAHGTGWKVKRHPAT